MTAELHIQQAEEALRQADFILSLPQVDDRLDLVALHVGRANAHLRIAELLRPQPVPRTASEAAVETQALAAGVRVTDSSRGLKDTPAELVRPDARPPGRAHPSDGHAFEPSAALRTRCEHCNQLPSVHQAGPSWHEVEAAHEAPEPEGSEVLSDEELEALKQELISDGWLDTPISTD